MAWVNDLIRSTNRSARILRGGEAEISLQAQAAVASELCRRYWDLLLDPTFKRDMEEAYDRQQKLKKNITNLGGNPRELWCHCNEAIALLGEAGMDSEYALEAVRSVQEMLANPNLKLGQIEPSEIFVRLQNAKKAVCRLRDELKVRAATESRHSFLRKLAVRGGGLVLVGLSATPLAAVVAAPIVAGAGVPIVAGLANAVIGAIGSAAFCFSMEETLKKVL
jgi:hypothetical protein